MDLFKLQAILGLDSSSYEQGMDKAEKKSSNFGSKLKSGLGTAAKVAGGAITAVGTGVVALGKSFISGVNDVSAYGDSIQKGAQKIGLSYEAYQKLAYAADLSGTNMGVMEKAQKQLLAAGSDIPLTDALIQCAEAEDVTAAAAEMFGEKVAMELTPMLNSGADGIRAMYQEAEEYGMVMSDDAIEGSAAFNDSVSKMQGTLNGVKNNLLGTFLPACTTVVDGLARIFNGDDSGVEIATEGIENLIEGILNKTPKILEVGGKIVINLLSGISQKLPTLVNSAIPLVMDFGQKIIEMLPTLVSVAKDIIINLASGISKNLPVLIPAVIDVILQICEALLGEDSIEQLINAALQLTIGLAEGLIKAIPILVKKAPVIIKGIVKGLLNSLPEIAKCGLQLIQGLWQGINDAAGWLWDKISGFFDGIVGGIKDFFGIHSPSKLFKDQIGKNLALGIGEGFSDTMDRVADEMQEAIPTDFNTDVAFGGIQDVPNYVNLALGDLETLQGSKNVTVVMEMDKKAFGQVTFDAYNNQRFLIGKEAMAI